MKARGFYDDENGTDTIFATGKSDSAQSLTPQSGEVETYNLPTTTVVTDSWDFSLASWQTYAGQDWSVTVFHGQYDHGDYRSSVGDVSSREYQESHDVVDALSYQFGDYYGYLQHSEHGESGVYSYQSPGYVSNFSSWLNSTTDVVSFQGPGLQLDTAHTDVWSGSSFSAVGWGEMGGFISQASTLSHDTIDTSHLAMLDRVVDTSHIVHSDATDLWFANPWGSMQSHIENASDSQTTHTASMGIDVTEVTIVGSHYEHTVSSGFLDWGRG